MEPFLYLPHVFFAAEYGLDHFETSMAALALLEPGDSVQLAKAISLAQLTTRKHYPGKHTVDALLNGKARPIGEFLVSRR
jgi:hypothetical protein